MKNARAAVSEKIARGVELGRRRQRLAWILFLTTCFVCSDAWAQGFGNVASEWEKKIEISDGFRNFDDMALVGPREQILLLGSFQIDSTLSSVASPGRDRVSRLELRKMDRSGGTLWVEAFDIHSGEPHDADGFVIDESGDIFVLGSFGQNRLGAQQALLARFSENGSLKFRRTLGNKGDDPRQILESPEGGFLVVGTRYVEEGELDRYLYMMKLDENGDYVGESVFKQFRGGTAAYAPNGDIVLVSTTRTANRKDRENVFLTISSDGQLLKSVLIPTNPPSSKHTGAVHDLTHLSGGGWLGFGSYIDLESSFGRKKNGYLRTVIISGDGVILKDNSIPYDGVTIGVGNVAHLPDGTVAATVSLGKKMDPDTTSYSVWTLSSDGEVLSKYPLGRNVMSSQIVASSDGTVILAGWYRDSEMRISGGSIHQDTRQFLRKMALD